ncbi:MAG: hypothetical protein J1E80_06455 [Desulfovibrionaceae bacterium]|nr:hypothetical protein [Desulfovibrionaceae bacterium]
MASPFWQYFHEKLNWPHIFQPGPVSALVKGLALSMDDVREDILWLRRQFSPATADAELIGRYGASRGIARHAFDSDDSYRLRVVNAFAWHKLGGKVRGLERIFTENRLPAAILPASSLDLWAHFRVRLDVSNAVFDMDAAALAFWLANEYKPARSKLETLWTTDKTPLDRAIAVGLRTWTTSGCRFWFSVPVIPTTTLKMAVGTVSLTSTRLAARPAA